MLIKKQNKVNKNRNTRIFFGAFILVALFLIPITRSAIRTTTVFVFSPVVYITNYVEGRISNIFETIKFKSTLVNENNDLNNQIINLNARYSNYNELVNENKQLKSVLNRSTDMNFILAAVVSKPPVSLYDTLLIDGGAGVGMEVGQTVYVDGTSPIGTINQVFSHSALVELYSSPSEKMDARLDPLNIDVTLFGRGGGDFLVSVPHDLIVPEGATVVTKEINPHVVGELQKAISDPRDSSQTLIFSSPINLNQLSFVEVLR